MGLQRLAEQVQDLKGAIDTDRAATAPVRPDGRAVAPRQTAKLPRGLTPREAEVLRLLARGMSNREIAATLVVTINTVERHLVSVYGKIGARGRVDATAYALRHGIVPSHDG